jgi:glycosyltransferase involved in cell wall biosynthesis
MGPWPRLELLPNPLPVGLGHPSAQPDAPRRPELLALARLVPQKGLDLLLRAFARLRDPSLAEWRVVLVGDGPEREALRTLAEREGVSERVAFEGFRSDPSPYLARASVFVLPSRFEGMPNALLEAMAAGLPVVVSDASPGPLEMVQHGVHGLVVSSENVEALAAALGRLMGDAGLREHLGQAARERLHAHDWEMLEPHWRSVLALPPAA